MKILSNFKDYYDWMVSKYGMDEKVVYNRVPEEEVKVGSWGKTGMYKPHHMDFPEDLLEYHIHFCGKIYVGYYIFGDWYYGKDILAADYRKYPSHVPTKHTMRGKSVQADIRAWQKIYGSRKHEYFIPKEEQKLHLSPSNKNDALSCPVVIGTTKNPRLSDFNFGKVIPPEDAFVMISNWLSREKEVVNSQTDKEKIVSHGFDLKTSFRNM